MRKIVSITVAIVVSFAVEWPVNAQGNYPLLEVKRNNTDVKDPNFRIDYLNWSKIPGHWVVKNYGDRFKWENVANKKLPNGTVCTLNAGNLVELREQKRNYVRVRMLDGPCTSVWGYMRWADLRVSSRSPVRKGKFIVAHNLRPRNFDTSTSNPDGSGEVTCVLFLNDLIQLVGRENSTGRVLMRPLQSVPNCQSGWVRKNILIEAKPYNQLGRVNRTIRVFSNTRDSTPGRCLLDPGTKVLIDSTPTNHTSTNEQVIFVRVLGNSCFGWVFNSYIDRIRGT